MIYVISLIFLFSFQIFPKTAKCTLTDYGPSGTKQIKDALCVLPLNIVNEKLYALLWFWFVGLALLSGLALLYRVIVFSCAEVRVWLLLAQTKKYVLLFMNNSNIT